MKSENDINSGISDEHHHSHRGHYHLHHDHHQEETHPDPPFQYGTFQGVPTYPPPRSPRSHPHPAMGFPHPVPPPGAINSSNPSQYYAHGYQTVPGYAISGRPVNEGRLPCCGMGVGWFLFIIGFFLGAIPWYVGATILACGRFDHREKPGYVTCTIAAILATIAVIFGATKASDVW